MVVLEDYERKNFELKTIGASVQRSGIYIFLISFSCLYLRWSRFPGQFGGKAKMDSGFDYAASFSSVSCIA